MKATYTAIVKSISVTDGRAEVKLVSTSGNVEEVSLAAKETELQLEAVFKRLALKDVKISSKYKITIESFED